jgi:hypothetical protein
MHRIRSHYGPSSSRILKPEALRLRRRLIVHMTADEYENLRSAAACESISSFVRGVLRERVRVQG